MRHKITEIVAILCYCLGIDALFYFLNRKAKRIITFHNVMPNGLLPNGKVIGLTDSEESFRLKIRILKSKFKIGTNVLDPNVATITFDDGYKNQAEIAGRILKEEGDLPAIIFAAGRMTNNNDSKEALVIDKLLHWTQLASNGVYTINNKTKFELTDSNRADIWEYTIWPAFIKDSANKGNKLLEDLCAQYSLENVYSSCNEEYLRLRMTGIDSTDIENLQNRGWLIGWHTQEHYPLSMLNAEERKREIVNSPKCCKSIVLSYPYGELESVNADCIKIAEEAGYPCAVSNVCEKNELMGKYFLPRMMLSDKPYLIHFELSGAKYFMKSKSLLPKLI